MFAKFRLQKSLLVSFLASLTKDEKPIDTESWAIDIEEKRKEYYEDLLAHAWSDKQAGVISGGKLKEYVFPTGEDGDYDVFISYSHDDGKEAQKLAFYLQEYCSLKVFLDCYIWDSADALLKKIDDDYCQTADRKHYLYKSRNYSTSHVHSLLSMAILDIINKTECCIFIDSNNSVNLHRLTNPKQAETLSPWIFEEISFMRYLPQRSTRKTRYFSDGGALELLNESRRLKIANPLDFSKFEIISRDDLWRLYKDKNDKLDHLYERHNMI